MSAVPRSVQRQAEAAAQIEQAIAAEQAQVVPPLTAEPLAPESLANPDPPQQPAAPAEPTPTPSTAPAEPEKDWKHLYKTMQGMYNSHVPRLQVQVEELTREVQALREKKVTAPAEAPAPAAVDPKDADTFGADLVEMVGRTAERVWSRLAAPILADLEKLKKLEGRVESTGQTVAITAEQSFWRDFEQMVPDWEAINASDDFRAWLSVEDPIYGERPQDALNKAQAQFNAKRAAQVFQKWKAYTAPPAAPTAAAKPSLEKQVAPNAGAPAASPSPAPSGEFITSKQIERFYNEIAQGKWRGRERERDAVEARINQALAEGRVR